MEVEEEKVENEVTSEVSNEVTNEISVTNDDVNIETEQNKFLETTIGKVINTGVDIALRAVLPSAIEDEVIGVKNVILNEGFQSGVKSAINSAIDIGKSALGIVTGKFDTVSQAYTAIKSGGIVDTASDLVDTAVKAAKENGLINNNTAKVIKKGKNIVKDCISSSIEENFMEQVDGVEKVGKYINNWNECLEQKDLTGMTREYNKIKKKLNDLLPIENTLQEARGIENVQTLIKNKGNSLENISEEEINLAKII